MSTDQSQDQLPERTVARGPGTGSPGPRAGRGPARHAPRAGRFPALRGRRLAAAARRARPVAAATAGGRLDAGPGCAALAGFAGDAAGDDDAYAGASDDEVIGAVCAWDRIEAHAAARKHAAVAELIRRRPAPGRGLEGPARMPRSW